jgi:flagella basal body P-ring formation protein FlgA
MNSNWKQKLSLFIALLLGLNVYAGTVQSIDTIEQVAYEFSLAKAQESYDNPQVVIGKLDTRLRLQTCNGTLNAFSKNTTAWLGKKTVGVKCDSPVAWTVYIPVQIKIFKPVYIAVRSLEAKTIITQQDLKLQQWDVGSLRQGYVKASKLIIGQQLKYSLAMGTVINSTHLRPQKVVRRGEYITLVAVAGKMEVRMNGTALSDASLGQRIKVKNTSSKRIVEGIVDAPGIVKIQL